MHYEKYYNLEDIVSYLNKDILIDYSKVHELRESSDIGAFELGYLDRSKTDEGVFKYVDDIVRLGMVEGDIVKVSPEVYVGTNNRVYYKNPPLINLSRDARSILYPGKDRYFVSLDVVSQEAYILLNELESVRLRAYYNTGDLYKTISDKLGVTREEAKKLWVKVVYGGRASSLEGDVLYKILKEEGFEELIADITKEYEDHGRVSGTLGECKVDTYYDTRTLGGRHKLFNSYSQYMGSELMVRLINKIEGSKRALGISDDDFKLEMMIHDELLYSADSVLVEEDIDKLLDCLKLSKDVGLSGWADLVFMVDIQARL